MCRSTSNWWAPCRHFLGFFDNVLWCQWGRSILLVWSWRNWWFFLVPEPMLHMQHWKYQEENFTPKSTNRLWVIYYLYSSLRIFENSTHSSKILGEFLFLLFFFFLSFRLLPISPFNSLLPWPNLSPNLFLTLHLGSAWLNLALLLFYFIFEWNSKPQLGEF